MNDVQVFKYLEKFFNKHLLQEKETSVNTINNYKDTFKLLFKYIREKCDFKINSFTFKHFTKDLIVNYLNWLEVERNNSISTRNLRLVMIKSFTSYVLEHEINILELKNILTIKHKKSVRSHVKYLTEEEIEILLNKPDKNNLKGRRELTIMCILYDGALRIDEFLNLKISDIKLKGENVIVIRKGKGSKYREVPISDNTVTLLNQYVKDYNLIELECDNYFFFNYHNEKLSSNAIRKIINKYVDMILTESQSFPSKVHPHMFRHAKATHLINKGVSIVEVQKFLGHEDISSTQIYITTDILQKRKALETIENELFDINTLKDEEFENPKTWLKELGIPNI